MTVLTEISCPNCLASIELHHHNNNSVRCGACHSNFIIDGHLCSSCHHYYKEEVDNCGRCGTAMKRVCNKCKTSNWAGDEFCKSCGVAMDLLDASIRDFHTKSAEHKAARRAQIKANRISEEKQSKKRMAEFKRIEQERLDELQARKKAKQWRELRALSFIGGVGVIILIITLYIMFGT